MKRGLRIPASEWMVYGHLWFSDGTQLALDGQSLEKVREQVGKRTITSYGKHELGNDANVYLFSLARDGAEKMVTGLGAVKAVLSGR